MKFSSAFDRRLLLGIGLAACLLAPGHGAEADLRDVIRDDFTFAAASTVSCLRTSKVTRKCRGPTLAAR